MAWFDEFNLPGATIDGYFGFIQADGPDDDDYPDVVLANGTVTFTATTEAARIDGAWLGIQPVTAQIFEGKIVISEEDPRPVRLLATDAPIGVADWAWRASFNVPGFRLNDLTFRAPRDTTVNLTADLIPIKSQPYQIIEGASIVDAEVNLDEATLRFALSDGSYTSWMDVPNGERGVAGPPGDKGAPGADGTAATLAMGTVTAGTTADAWMTGTPLARELNLTLPRGAKGERGEAGPPGPDGPQGIPGEYAGKGDSAYEIAVADGFTGTESEWLDSLVGPVGPPGESQYKGVLNAAMIAQGFNNAFTMPKGSITIPNVTYANQVANLPEAFPGLLTADMNDGSPIRFLKYTPHNRDYTWETQTQNVSGAFMPWRKVGGPVEPAPVVSGANQDLGQMAQVQRQTFKRRRGGVIGTAGKPVIALRWDHGLVNFRDLILPHLIRLGLPGSMAMNSASNRWTISESSGVTSTDLNGWARDYGIEVWNHSQTHGAAESVADLTREIVTGKTELQALMPSVPVEGFVIPGVPSGNYAGFSAGESPTNWDTIAGRLILAHHGASSSHMAGTDGRMTGDQQILGRQVSIDAMTGPDVIAVVDRIIARRAGGILFLHPSQLDLSGKITATDYVTVLEYLAAQRAAGNLEVLTMGGLSVADSERTYRHDFMVDPAFTSGNLAAWGSPANWALDSGDGSATTGVSNTSLSQTVSFTSGQDWASGGARDFVVRMRARTAEGNSNYELKVGNVTRTGTVTGTAWTEVRMPSTISTAATGLTLSIRRVSGAYLHVQSARWLAC